LAAPEMRRYEKPAGRNYLEPHGVSPPPGAAWQIGHVRAPLIADQVEADAEAIPALLERRDAGIAAADLGGVGAGRKCFPQLADPCANHSI